MMKPNLSEGIDETDVRVLDLLIQNHGNKHISTALKIPLSTIQRRVRNLIEKGFIVSKNQINFTKLGFKSGTVHIYLDDGNFDAILDKVSTLKGVISLEVHIGNSDIIAGVVYKLGSELLQLITTIKKLNSVERILWSERILEYALPSNNASIMELAL